MECHADYVIGGVSVKMEDSFGQLCLKRLRLGQQTVVENPRLRSIQKVW